MKSITKWLLSLYVAGAIITMGFQIYYRYPACSGASECGLAVLVDKFDTGILQGTADT
jgi:predicted benzoate:H+ symporter BenE